MSICGHLEVGGHYELRCDGLQDDEFSNNRLIFCLTGKNGMGGRFDRPRVCSVGPPAAMGGCAGLFFR